MLCCLWTASSEARVQLYDAQRTLQINKQLKTFWEPDGPPLDIQQVLEMGSSSSWLSKSNPNYGFSSQAIWLMTELSNQSNQTDWVVNVGFAQNDKVDFYLLADGQIIQRSAQGKLQGNQQHRFPSFQFSLPFAKRHVLLVRVQSLEQPVVVPINIASTAAFGKAVAQDNLWWGMFYGGLIILIFYNFVLYWVTRERSLIAYGGYIFAAVLWQFVWGGHSQLMFSTGLNDWFTRHTDVIFLLVGLGAGWFTMSFLHAKHTAKNTYRFIVPLMCLLAAMLLLALTNLIDQKLQNGLVYGISIIAICSYLVAGLESYFNDFKPARYFVFAWSILLMTAMIGLLGLLTVLPSNAVTTYCFQVGVFTEAALFSIALIEKTRHKMEKEVKIVTKDLVNNIEIIEAQNVHLDLARKDAIKASAIKSQFLANMSHEIRTPLNAIIGFSQELSKLSLPLEPSDHVQIINQSATNLMAIVNDVLDFSKIEAGKLEVNQEPFSPGDILEELVFVFAKAAQKKQLKFYYEPCPLPNKLIGDGARVKQVLTNLLSNAVKFTKRGSVSLEVAIKPGKGDRLNWCLRVVDTGIGIAEKNRDKLFKSFSQLDDSLNRNYQGTGLGLVISQQLVFLMKGRLNYQSEYGQGSCFEVEIPCHSVTRHMDMTPSQDWQGKKVLLWVSDPRSRYINANLLCSLGAEVTSGNSLGWLRTQVRQFDYLFTDESSVEQYRDKDILRLMRTLDVDQRVLLVGAHGAPVEAFANDFHQFLESPLLLSRLRNFQREEAQNTQNIWTERLLSLPAIRILAVDDMPINLRLLKTWLQDSPVELVLCHSGQEAFEHCQQADFDLILMDVQMPDMDGLEATRLIRKTSLNQGTPVIAVTAHAFKEEQEKLMNSGMDDYLPKPLELAQLINIIKRWCSVPESAESSSELVKSKTIESVLPDLDWQLALNRSYQNPKAAHDLLQEFCEQLPESFNDIESASHLEDWPLMQQQVHRLHGACCYTGVPKLQRLCAEIEAQLKEQHFAIAAKHMSAMREAVEQVLIQQAAMTSTQ